ncbi:MAG: hypothetical protein AVDCRST_MAG68-1091 [uncultured Gemmatimonadetes bacterium]|uniref:Uncharacterized protein n=1 Tax=uncultured Gemmatimonadota bacterium TaxID=203437 RepID=A0A6J4KNY0_9BACT|nr:MAG: hypothetical protein AVDCRST_MAG68-1091 [uncultured Gemmatimonadota bacterium]
MAARGSGFLSPEGWRTTGPAADAWKSPPLLITRGAASPVIGRGGRGVRVPGGTRWHLSCA